MRAFAVLLLSSFLAACAAGGSIEQISTTSAAIDTRQAGVVVVKTALADRAAVADSLRQTINKHLMEKRVFNSLPISVEQADIVLDVEITEVSEVGQGARILLGALAGQASITATVNVIDRKTSASLGAMKAQGKSSGGHIFAGTTSEALDQIATQISDYLLRNRKN